ncbi:hypothetical protein HU761_04685 [Pseudomonas sp. SWRI59]|uniref:hypothetical protein n=1 Tax=Pseudomonas TaxID=286 RepID=UPI001644D4B4|nr:MULTISPECIES: hypothetical protein [unclassified Pseudomonas]MBC3481128.1 hypothetical protein [Pseudomonas sp. SWRI77]MBC3500695.1 hypothetical protein [Pseudomonas sp. SWRI59]MBC3506458.1 hypothetical protein [Pseudomonas sp. SWRI68]UVL02969.1 hypothetical protein LOY26_21440 [Pseudomonas sp. B21-047]
MPPSINGAERSMARREFPQFEAVSAMVPVEGGGYNAAIAVKALGLGGAPRFHKVLDGQVFKGAMAADEAACAELERLQGVSDEGELIW